MKKYLGSGKWSFKKLLHNFKKGHENYNKIENLNSVKDSFNKKILNYISDILKDIAKKESMANEYYCGYNKYGLFILGGLFTDDVNVKDFEDSDSGKVRSISFNSEKYNQKVYLPKLTQYVKKHKLLPSEKQLRKYLEDVISKRYENNLKKQKLKKPERYLSKTDVEDF